MARQGMCQAVSFINGFLDLGNYLFERRTGGLLHQSIKGPYQWYAGAQQSGQLAGQGMNFLISHPVENGQGR